MKRVEHPFSRGSTRIDKIKEAALISDAAVFYSSLFLTTLEYLFAGSFFARTIFSRSGNFYSRQSGHGGDVDHRPESATSYFIFINELIAVV
jgi:hypothetical protein